MEEANQQLAEETANLEKLKQKMEMIKQSAHALQRKSVEKFISHDAAIHRGDYIMFSKAIDEDESTLSIKSVAKKPLSVDKEDELVAVSGGFFKQFFYKVMKELGKRMHAVSKGYSFVLKIITSEKKSLIDSISPKLTESGIAR